MDRAEAEAIYDAGREVCVEFILELAARVEHMTPAYSDVIPAEREARVPGAAQHHSRRIASAFDGGRRPPMVVRCRPWTPVIVNAL